MPEITYYLGEQPYRYDIGELTANASIISMMDEENWIYGNGSYVEGPGEYLGNGVFEIFTNEPSLEDVSHVTFLRGCSRLGEFFELSLNVKIKANTPPTFETTLTTDFVIAAIGDVLDYTLPKVFDKQANDEIETYVDYQVGGRYPPYIFYNNVTRIITFRPHSLWF